MERQMKSIARRTVLLFCFASLITLALFSAVLYQPAISYTRLIAMSWGDGRDTQALYGAYVGYEPLGKQLQVRATIYIDRPGLWWSYQHDPITLGVVATEQEAVARWGRIEWSAEGVRFGAGSQVVLFKREDLERHR